MQLCDESDAWSEFLHYAAQKCSAAAFDNWLAPIRVLHWHEDELVLEVPNIFVQEYLLANYREDLAAFLPVRPSGEPALSFVIAEPKPALVERFPEPLPREVAEEENDRPELLLNGNYRFETYIEGPQNQFVKSAALGVATRPGKSYNPLFVHGGVGLGKTHLLHAIGHFVKENHTKLRIQCITTEAFINDLVDSLRNKSVDRLKRYYRSLDVLLVDDIQFLQHRLNFEEEFCNTFEALINQNKQIVISSDKPPGQLKLSERIVARMEWGLVASVNIPDLETRVAILLHKAEQKGLRIPQRVAFFIAEHIFSNVRQLEGAINRLSAHCRLLNLDITEELVEKTLRELLQHAPKDKITVEQVLKAVATIFQVGIPSLKGSARTKEIALSRQVAMYLAREMVQESLTMIAVSFGKKRHSTVIFACQQVEKRMKNDEKLRRRVDMVRRKIEES
jgi:chromosomal replication initiator protein